MAKVKAYQSYYRTFEIQALAAKKENNWYGLYVVARLSAEDKPEEDVDSLSVNDKLVIIRRVEKFDIKKFRRFIESIGGVLEFPKRSLMLNELSSSSLIQKEKVGWSLWNLLNDSEKWPVFILNATGKQIQSVIDVDALTKVINTSKPVSYTSIEQLTKKHLDIQLSPSIVVSVFVVAPVYCKLEEAVLSDNGRLSGSVRIHRSLDPSLLSLSVVYENDEGGHAGNYSQDFAEQGIQDGDFNVYKIEDSEEKEQVKAARVFFSFGDWTSNEYLTVPNDSRPAAIPSDLSLPVLRMFHGGKQLDEFLTGSAGKAEEHQAATAWLLSILGFKSFLLSNIARNLEMIFDENKSKRGSADVLAYDADKGRIMIIDSTIWTANTKIDEIRGTAEYIKEKTGIEVTPVVLSRLSLKTAKKLAEDDVVRVIDVDDVKNILKLVNAGNIKEAKQLFLSLLNKPSHSIEPY